MRRRPRQGMTLLEVLVALAILSAGALSIAALGAQSWRAVHAARDADRSTADASAFLDAVALWPREELDQRLGDRVQQPWRLRIDRPLPTLYVVTLADSSGRDTILATSLFRPEAPRAP
jgi:prepilin-type N-terminal cleavage/methylation domain-containing protein